MKPSIGALTTDSMRLSAIVTEPCSSRASRSRAICSWSTASACRRWTSSYAAGETMPCSLSARCRASSRPIVSSSMPRSSSWRLASTSSSGVGSGRISSSGEPARTKSPISAKRCRTTPDTFDFTLISTSGSIVPTARARSTISPRVTSTAGAASSPAELSAWRKDAAPAMTAMPTLPRTIFVRVLIAKLRSAGGRGPVRGASARASCVVVRARPLRGPGGRGFTMHASCTGPARMSLRPRCIALAAVLCAAACGREQAPAPAPGGATFRAAVDGVLPSVVYIQVEAARPIEELLPPLPPGVPLPEMPPGGTQLGAGSGVIRGREGYVLTSDHVVEGATEVMVAVHDRREFEARVVARGPSTDVAVLKIEPGDYPVARLGDSDRLQLGDWVLAVGSPLGLQFSVSAGVVSAKGRSIGILGTRRDGAAQAAPLEHFIQTDAAMNPGNSGGPLVDLEGRVVGINTAIASPTGLYFGYGFAVPINLARRVADQLIRQGYVSRAYLGVMLDEVETA